MTTEAKPSVTADVSAQLSEARRKGDAAFRTFQRDAYDGHLGHCDPKVVAASEKAYKTAREEIVRLEAILAVSEREDAAWDAACRREAQRNDDLVTLALFEAAEVDAKAFEAACAVFTTAWKALAQSTSAARDSANTNPRLPHDRQLAVDAYKAGRGELSRLLSHFPGVPDTPHSDASLRLSGAHAYLPIAEQFTLLTASIKASLPSLREPTQ